MKLLLIFILSLFFTALFANDIVIYVSPKGKGTGTAKSPASLQQAVAIISGLKKSNPSGSITVILKDGLYELDRPILIDNENSGSENLKIIFKADTNSHPILSGGRRVVLKGEKIVSADLASLIKHFNTEPYDIYVNGKRAVRARTPNDGFIKLGRTVETKDSSLAGKNNSIQCYGIPKTLHDQLSILPETEIKRIRFNIYHKWDNTMRTLDSLGKNDAVFYSTGETWKSFNAPGKDAIFYLENYEKALDTASEWIFQGNLLKYIPVKSTCKQLEVIVPLLEKLLIIRGDSASRVSNISFQGIAFCYSNKPFVGYESWQAAMAIDAAVMIDYADNIKFENCEISHTGQYAIWLREGVNNCELAHCCLNDLGAGGIRIGETILRENKAQWTSGNKVENCIIHSGGLNYPSAVGVFIAHSANNTIVHNDIADFRYTAVSVGWVWGYAYSPSVNNKILYNHIHHIGWGVLSDMAGVYTLGISDGTEVSNNVVHHIYSYDYGGWGLYTDEGSTHIRMENNLVYNTKTGGFHQHYGKENLILNNIIAFNDKYQAQFSRIEDHKSFTFMHNIILSDRGFLLQGAWEKGNVTIDSNCYWNMNSDKCIFMQSTQSYGGNPHIINTLTEWQKQSGKDTQSIFQDPGFVNQKEFNFELADEAVVKSIGFKPFNIADAGVYGDKQWIEQAKLPKEIIDAFNESVSRNMLP